MATVWTQFSLLCGQSNAQFPPFDFPPYEKGHGYNYVQKRSQYFALLIECWLVVYYESIHTQILVTELHKSTF